MPRQKRVNSQLPQSFYAECSVDARSVSHCETHLTVHVEARGCLEDKKKIGGRYK